MNLHIQSTLVIKVLLKSQPLCWRCDTLYDDIQHNDTHHNDTQKTHKKSATPSITTLHIECRIFLLLCCVSLLQ